MKHDLKTWPKYFDAVWNRSKTFELRKNDRNYKVGDILCLREYDNEVNEYSGRELLMGVAYILEGGVFGLDKEMCIMSLTEIGREEDY